MLRRLQWQGLLSEDNQQYGNTKWQDLGNVAAFLKTDLHMERAGVLVGYAPPYAWLSKRILRTNSEDLLELCRNMIRAGLLPKNCTSTILTKPFKRSGKISAAARYVGNAIANSAVNKAKGNKILAADRLGIKPNVLEKWLAM